MARVVVGVMGPGEGATDEDRTQAEHLGERIAERGWITLTGGRPVGVMGAALAGARRRNGLTIGVLPDRSAATASPDADIRIVTGLGEARNLVNVLSSDVVCVCGMSAGTASEVALALKTARPTILIAPGEASERPRVKAASREHVCRGLTDLSRVADRDDRSITREGQVRERPRLPIAQRFVRVDMKAVRNRPLGVVVVGSDVQHRDGVLCVEPISQGVSLNLLGHHSLRSARVAGDAVLTVRDSPAHRRSGCRRRAQT